jgi:tape measure domain-containing protein
MSFNISIAVETSAAKSAIAGVGTSLSTASTQGAAAGKAISAGLNSSTMATDKAKASTDRLAQSFAGVAKGITSQGLGAAATSFAGLNAQLTREADLLERIRGPQKQYMEDLAAVEMLQRKGTITAAEYAVALQQIKNDSGGGAITQRGVKSTGGTGAAPTSNSDLSELAGGAGGGNFAATFGAITEGGTAAAGAVGALAIGIVHLNDSYTELANSAARFTDAAHDTNDVLIDQYGLSMRMNSGLGSTMELSNKVREGTDDMNLSLSERDKLTQVLGQSSILAGKGVDGATGAMQAFAFAAESGGFHGREIRAVMKSLPEVGEILRSTLHKSNDEIIKMADKGELASQTVINALMKDTTVAEKFNGQLETTSQKWQHIKDGASIAGGGIGSAFMSFAGTDGIDAASAAFKKLNAEMAEAKLKADELALGPKRTAAAYVALNDVLAHQAYLFDTLTRQGALNANQGAMMNQMLTSSHANVRKSFDDLEGSMGILINAQSRAADGFKNIWYTDDKGAQQSIMLTSTLLRTFEKNAADARFEYEKLMHPQISGAIDIRKNISDAKQALVDLKFASKLPQDDPASITTREYASLAKKAREQIRDAYGDQGTDYYKNMYEAVKGPQRDFMGNTRALDALLAEGRITLAQYTAEVNKLGDAFNGKEFREAFELMTRGGVPKPEKMVSTAQGNVSRARFDAMAKYNEAVTGSESTYDVESRKNVERDLAPDLEASAKAAAEYNAIIDKAHAPLDTYIKGQRTLDQVFKDGKISPEEYSKDIDALRRSYLEASGAAKTFAGGAELALLDIKAQATDVGGAIHDQLVGAFKGGEDALVSLISTGKADWRGLLDTIGKDAARTAVRGGESAIAGLFKGGSEATAATTAMAAGGTVAGTTIAADMIGAGSIVAADIAAAIAGAGAASGAAGAAGGAVSVVPGPSTFDPTNATSQNGGSFADDIERRGGRGSGGLTVHLHQDKDALLPALDRRSGHRLVGNIVLKENGIALAIRGRNG